MRIPKFMPMCFLLGTAFTSYSQDTTKPDFKSAEVRSEIQSFIRSTDEAKKSFADALSELISKHNSDVSKLKDEHLSRLESFLKQTTQAADLDEAIKIRDAIALCRDAKIELPDFRKLAELSAAKNIELEKQIAELTHGKGVKPGPKTRQSIVGTWRWFNGSDALFRPNGTAEGNVNQAMKLPEAVVNGTWKSTDGKYQFLITWSNGSIDTLTMTEDGKLLEGRASLDGKRVWAVRLK